MTSGYNNTGIGDEVLRYDTSGHANTALGHEALFANTNGYANTGVGYQALYSNTTGFQNFGMGYSSLYSNTTGTYNTAIGFESMRNSNAVSGYNIAIGTQALKAVTANDNIAIGTSSQLVTSTGAYNVSFGTNCMISNTSGSYNVSSGYNSLYSNTTGINNCAWGVQALGYNTTGRSNSAVGRQSLGQSTTGSNNIAIGDSAAWTNTTGSNNTILGGHANVGSNNLTYATAIGADAVVSASNSIALGNTSAKVGIAMTTPTAKLHLPAQTSAANNAAMKFTPGTALATIEAMTIENDTMGFYETNSALNRYAIGGPIKDFYTDANNSGTGETDLYSYTTKASTLKRNGEKITAKYAGTFNDVTATEQIKVLFAGTTIFDSGAITTLSTGQWTVDVTIIRTGSTTCRASVSMYTPTATIMLYSAQTDMTGLTLSNTNILKVTGTAGGGGGGSNDITAKLGVIYWDGAANN